MRRQDHVGGGQDRVARVERFRLEHVEPGPADFARRQGASESRLVDEQAAGGVHQQPIGTEGLQEWAVDDVA